MELLLNVFSLAILWPYMAIIWEAKIPNPYYGHIDFNNLPYMVGKIGPYMAIYGLFHIWLTGSGDTKFNLQNCQLSLNLLNDIRYLL